MKKNKVRSQLSKAVMFVSLLHSLGLAAETTCLATAEIKSLLREGSPRLIMYYMPISTFTQFQISRQSLTTESHVYRIAMASDEFTVFFGDSLISLTSKELQEVDLPNPLNYRVVIEIWNEKQLIYTFGLPGRDYGMEVCGKTYKSNRAFYEFIRNFIPVSELADFTNELDKMDVIFQDTSRCIKPK